MKRTVRTGACDLGATPQREFFAGHKQRQLTLGRIDPPPKVLGAAAEPPGISPSQVQVVENFATGVLALDVGRLN